MKLLIDLLFGIIFGISLAGLGVIFFKKVLSENIDFFTGFFAGCGLAVIILFIVGLAGLYNRAFFSAFIIFIFLFSITGRRSLMREEFPIDKRYLLPLILLFGVILAAALSSLSPPIKNDTLYYHLGLPKLWAEDGGIRFYPTISFSATALNSEMLLTPIMAFVSPEAAQFFVCIVGLMVLLLLGRGFNRLTGSSQIVALLALGSVPLFLSGLTDAKNDYLAAGFALCSFLFYIDYVNNDNTKQIILAGVFAGLAASTKTNAIIYAISLFAVILLSRHRAKDVALFAIGAVLLGMPWYLKAYLQTGNPVFPFYNNWFDSMYWQPVFDSFNKATNVRSESQGLVNFITSPFRLVYFPDIFRGRIGPSILIFLPLLFFLRQVPRIIFKALLISLIFYFFWYIAWPNARYLMPIIPLLALTAALIIDRLFKISRLPGYIAICGLSLLIAAGGIQLIRDGSFRIKAALGLIDHDYFLQTVSVLDPNQLESPRKSTALPYYDIWQFLNVTADPDAVIGILCSNWNRADGFYLDRHHLYLNPSDQVIIDFTSDRTQIAQSLAKQNIRYVLIDKLVIVEFSPEGDFNKAPGFDIFSRGVNDFVDIIKRNGQLIYLTDRFELYRIRNLSVISKEPFS